MPSWVRRNEACCEGPTFTSAPSTPPVDRRDCGAKSDIAALLQRFVVRSLSCRLVVQQAIQLRSGDNFMKSLTQKIRHRNASERWLHQSWPTWLREQGMPSQSAAPKDARVTVIPQLTARAYEFRSFAGQESTARPASTHSASGE